MTPQEERAIAAEYTGRFAWPTLVYTAMLLTVHVGTIVASVQGHMPLWLGMLLSSWFTYMWYTVHHDATHESICGQHKNLLWLNNAAGHISAIPLQLSFTHYSKSHLLHHAHTNNPERDPDYMATTGTMRQIPIRILLVQIIKYLSFIPYIEKFAPRILPPLLAQGVAGTKSGSGTFRYQRNCFLVVLAGVVAGYGAEMLMLYVIPSIIGIGLLVTWFQWLPHQPNTSTDRYLNTRVYTWLFSTVTLIE